MQLNHVVMLIFLLLLGLQSSVLFSYFLNLDWGKVKIA